MVAFSRVELAEILYSNFLRMERSVCIYADQYRTKYYGYLRFGPLFCAERCADTTSRRR
jgi:hypothetical protein